MSRSLLGNINRDKGQLEGVKQQRALECVANCRLRPVLKGQPWLTAVWPPCRKQAECP